MKSAILESFITQLKGLTEAFVVETAMEETEFKGDPRKYLEQLNHKITDIFEDEQTDEYLREVTTVFVEMLSYTTQSSLIDSSEHAFHVDGWNKQETIIAAVGKAAVECMIEEVTARLLPSWEGYIKDLPWPVQEYLKGNTRDEKEEQS